MIKFKKAKTSVDQTDESISSFSTSSNNPKRSASPLPTEGMTESGKNKRIKKVTLVSAQNELYQCFSSYKRSICDVQTVIERIDCFKKDLSKADYPFLFISSRAHQISYFYNKDDGINDKLYQYILNELEQLFETSPTLINEIIDKERLNDLIIALCQDEVYFKNTLEKPNLKQIIHQYYLDVILYHHVDSSLIESCPLAFLNKYLSDAEIDRLKSTPLSLKGKSRNFLDVCHANLTEYIPDLWAKGFRPHSLENFAHDLFSSGQVRKKNKLAIKISSGVYDQLLADYAADLCQFTDSKFLIECILNNPAIEIRHVEQFMQYNSFPTLADLMASIRKVYWRQNFRFTYDRGNEIDDITHGIDKIIYFLSRINEPLNSPADPGIAEVLKKNQGTNPKEQVTDPQLTNTVANELFLFTINWVLISPPQFKLDRFNSVLKLVQLFKEDELSQLGVLRGFLYTFLINSQHLAKSAELSPTAGRGRKKTSLNSKEFLNKLLDRLTENLSQEDANPVFAFFVQFALNYFSFPKQKVITTQSGAFLSGILMSRIKDQDSILDCKYHIANLLILILNQLNNFGYNKTLKIQEIKAFIASLNLENPPLFTAMVFAQAVGNRVKKGIIFRTEELNLLSEIEPTWIKYLPTSKDHNTNTNVLTACLRRIGSVNDPDRVDTLTILLTLLQRLEDHNDVILPVDFLHEVANWQLNIQKRASLGEQVKSVLDTIYNLCIHKTQQTGQEKAFDDIRTQLLIKFGDDPSKDPQAIHTRENHAYAEQIYNQWFNALMITEVHSEIANGLKRLSKYIYDARLEKARSLIAFNQVEQANNCLLFMLGDTSVPNSNQFKDIKSQLSLFNKVIKYIEVKIKKAQEPIAQHLSQSQKTAIEDAKKLTDMLGLAFYFAHNPGPTGFALLDGVEALKILTIELLDQVSHTSCDQGPFIRLLMALEPVAEFHFPLMSRRTLPIFVTEYINQYFNHLSEQAKAEFIALVYTKVDDKETIDVIEFIPEDSFTFLIAQFVLEHKQSFGFLTEDEVAVSFASWRPAALHPEIIALLNSYHQEQKTPAPISLVNRMHSFFGQYSSSHVDDTLGDENSERSSNNSQI